MKAWLLALRPKTLPAALVPVWMGNLPLLAAHWKAGEEPFSWGLFWATLASCVSIQIATNLFNDAIDARKGADTAGRLGPRRATASGMLPAAAVLAGAVLFCVLAALAALPLILARGNVIVVIGAVSLFFAYGYTGGPFPLAYKGQGELFVILFFGLVAVGGSYFAQSGQAPGPGEWLVAVQVGCFSTVLIAINNLRDRREDEASGKRTLAVRFGERFARGEIALFCLGPALLGLAGGAVGDWRLAWPAVFLLPLTMGIVLGVLRTEPSRKFNRFLGLSALQLVGFAVISTLVRGWA